MQTIIQVMFIVICFAYVLSGPFLIFVYWIYDSVKNAERKKAFLNMTSEYVKMRIYLKSCGSHSRIYIFSVNGNPPVYDKSNVLLLPIGINKIKAHFEPLVDHPMIPYMAGRSPSLKELKSRIRPPEENSILIELDTVQGGQYEMKGDTYNKSLNIVCLEGEGHEIKSFA